MLTQQLTADYVMSQHAWEEITTKLNEMAKENRLIKQEVHKTYNTATGVLGKSKNKTLTTSPNDRTNLCKQSNQEVKTPKSTTTPTQ